MDDKRPSPDIHSRKRNGTPMSLNPAFDFLVQIPQKLENCLTTHFKWSAKIEEKTENARSVPLNGKGTNTSFEFNLEKQLLAWKENPTWVDEPPKIKVSVPKGSFCNLGVKFKVGLPPDAIYDIVIDPDNRRVFKNIKEVRSRRVLVDEGLRQLVEVEQAAIWRFLWWSGTISVHVLVDQNRENHTVRFKQGKTGFMKRFEGCWKLEPLFVDEHLCFPYRPETCADYDLCTGGKGRVGSIVQLEQIIQPALLPPPPISWYLRGITTRTTEMLINDLLAEAARIRGAVDYDSSTEALIRATSGDPVHNASDIKERWKQKRSKRRHRWSINAMNKASSFS